MEVAAQHDPDENSKVEELLQPLMVGSMFTRSPLRITSLTTELQM